jgi:hypothetical protein
MNRVAAAVAVLADPSALNRVATAVAVLAVPFALLQFEQLRVGLHDETAPAFRVCNHCFKMFKAALLGAHTIMKDAKELQAPVVRQRAILLDKCFSFDKGQKTLVWMTNFFFLFFFYPPTLTRPFFFLLM